MLHPYIRTQLLFTSTTPKKQPEWSPCRWENVDAPLHRPRPADWLTVTLQKAGTASYTQQFVLILLHHHPDTQSRPAGPGWVEVLDARLPSFSLPFRQTDRQKLLPHMSSALRPALSLSLVLPLHPHPHLGATESATGEGATGEGRGGDGRAGGRADAQRKHSLLFIINDKSR